MSKYAFLVPTLDEAKTDVAVENLQKALDILNDLALTLKHAHWNVTGQNFIAVHELLDPEIDSVRDAVDEIAERIAALGGAPNGLSTQTQKSASQLLPEYPLKGRANTIEHLKAVDAQYTAVNEILRTAIEKLDDADLVSSNILQDALGNLEAFQWKVRSHLV
ncbi:MAG: DNA starvation/stationary phase protection protein [Candidatus Ancillula sp.]|jgi:starvation-inducible DNA-binding protein|nr:DNA starvation/stationary phase protection protein [Candidatus Ancillula sp.]